MQAQTAHFPPAYGSSRPMRDLLLQLPLLTANSAEVIQYEKADAVVLTQIADNAETAMNVIHLGLSAVGHILAHAAPEVGSDIGSDTVEALGRLMEELGSFAATAFSISAACRHHTADFSPPVHCSVASARP